MSLPCFAASATGAELAGALAREGCAVERLDVLMGSRSSAVVLGERAQTTARVREPLG
jgi:hypothetical protein